MIQIPSKKRGGNDASQLRHRIPLRAIDDPPPNGPSISEPFCNRFFG